MLPHKRAQKSWGILPSRTRACTRTARPKVLHGKASYWHRDSRRGTHQHQRGVLSKLERKPSRKPNAVYLAFASLSLSKRAHVNVDLSTRPRLANIHDGSENRYSFAMTMLFRTR